MANIEAIKLIWLLWATSVGLGQNDIDCNSEPGPDLIVNHNAGKDRFLIFQNGVRLRSSGPVKNGIPNIVSVDKAKSASISWMYFNGTEVLARLGPQICKAEKEGLTWDCFAPIASQDFYLYTLSITAFEDKLIVQTLENGEYKQSLVTLNGTILATVKSSQVQSVNPSSLTRTSGNDVIAFFGPLVGIYKRGEGTKLPIILRGTIKYGLSRLWLNCEPDLCLDATVDAVTSSGTILELHRAKFVVQVDRKAARPTVSITKATYTDGSLKDAAIRVNHSLTMFAEKNVVTVTDDNLNFQTRPLGLVYPGRSLAVDAAFVLLNETHLIDHSVVTVYSSSNAELNVRSMADMWPELPRLTIDGATVYQNQLYFFVGDYFYTSDLPLSPNANAINGPFLTQFHILNCNSNHYQTSKAAKMLGIVDTASFEKYISQFVPVSSVVPPTRPVDTTVTTTEAKAVKKPVVQPAVVAFGVTLVILVLLSLTVYLFTKKTNKRNDVSKKPMASVDSKTL
ncbi:hypothetical protein HDE_13052 [Halotydeus destructor]|nr:hypothetical protein HDE_13052 [Halotydeus destructor]